jgi:hypothetical protein
MPKKTFVPGEVLFAADVNNFLMDQSVMTFADTTARGTAIPTPTEGMVAYLNDSNTIQAYNSTSWVTVGNAGTASYNLVQTVYFTSSGTFTKATYPWLRAIKVKVQGAGGGGGGTGAINATPRSAVAGGGGGGAYAESFITDIAGLASSITVTRGAGGAGGAAGANNGSAGGSSSFGTAVSANGGSGADGNSQSSLVAIEASGGGGSSTGVGDIVLSGEGGMFGMQIANQSIFPARGGSSFLGRNTHATRIITRGDGNAGLNGSGGTGGAATSVVSSTQAATAGGAGGNGIVIVELYA